MRNCLVGVISFTLILASASASCCQEKGLVGYWKLRDDGQDSSGRKRDLKNHGVQFTSTPQNNGKSASFDGIGAFLEGPTLDLRKRDFSLSLWVHTTTELADLPGDLVSVWDKKRRRGLHLTLKTNAGVTFNQANDRHLQFSIDNNRERSWEDCGTPGNALLAFGLAVHKGELYASTCEPGKDDAGKVYRYAGKQQWNLCGTLDGSNAVTTLAVHNGELYAGTGKYRVAGSALPESPNKRGGGRIYRYLGGTKWDECGKLPGAEAVGGLVVYRGALYASSLYRPAGFFRYDGGSKWTDCGTPDGKRVEALGVYNGFLYATSYDGGFVYRFDGKSWTSCGKLGDNTQTYSFAVFEGRLYVGTWPSGRVFRFEKPGAWTDVGRLGAELEVMGMLVHNGRLIAGTLPSAEVYCYERDGHWRKLTQLDATPDVKYRRAWTMAEHRGRVYGSTLPSGKIFAWQAGQGVAWGQTFPAGWHHVAAVKKAGMLAVYVDGKQVGRSEDFNAEDYDLGESPLRIGIGVNDYFHGSLREVRLYDRALEAEEIEELFK